MVPNVGKLYCSNILFVRNNVVAHRSWRFLQFLENQEIKVLAWLWPRGRSNQLIWKSLRRLSAKMCESSAKKQWQADGIYAKTNQCCGLSPSRFRMTWISIVLWTCRFRWLLLDLLKVFVCPVGLLRSFCEFLIKIIHIPCKATVSILMINSRSDQR